MSYWGLVPGGVTRDVGRLVNKEHYEREEIWKYFLDVTVVSIDIQWMQKLKQMYFVQAVMKVVGTFHSLEMFPYEG